MEKWLMMGVDIEMAIDVEGENNFSKKLCLFFFFFFCGCFALATWIWMQNHPQAISILFAVH